MARQIGALLLVLLSLQVHAETRIDMDGTSVIGNQELPRILYIVPWKKTELPDMGQPPIGRMMNEILTPIERDVFKRQIYYHHIFFEQSSGKSENQ